MRRMLFLLAAMVLAAASVQAQGSDSLPSCRADLDGLREKIETNYAGVLLEVRGARRAEYDALLGRLRPRANATAPASCFPVLRALTDWFGDPHLFVYQNPVLDSAESRRRRETVRRLPMDEAAARRYLETAQRLDPIEGIWHEGPLRLAIVRGQGSARDSFLAVVLTPDTASWEAGTVRAMFKRRADGSYDATVWAPNYAIRHLDAVLHKRVLLRMSPGMWGREFPVLPADSGLLDPIDAHRPTMLVRGRTVIVSMTSHDPANRPVLDSLMARHRDALNSAERLIVDLRGNEGGSSWVSDPLLPFIATNPPRPPRTPDRPAVMLSSPDQVRYATRAFGDTTTPFVSGLLARLRAAPGTLVPFEDPAAPSAAPAADSIRPGPARVAVLIDGGTVSAAEVIVLKALRSTRATVFGMPSAGALDYQSTSVVRIHPSERRWYLGYPTITAHASLPLDGMRGRGIAPDVVVDWNRIADPLRWIEARLSH